MCKCGEGCEEYSCFIGYNCQCCLDTYGDRLLCDCHECRMARIDERNRLTAEEAAEILRSAPDSEAGPPLSVEAREAE